MRTESSARPASPPAQPAQATGDVRYSDERPTTPLHAEHRQVLSCLETIDRLLSLASWTEKDAQTVDEAMRSIRGLLPPHYLKEEQILFPEILRVSGPSVAVVEALRDEHFAVESAFTDLQAVVFALGMAQPTPRLRRQARQRVRTMTAMCKAHIGRELEIFAVADERLDRTAAARVLAGFRAIDTREEWKRTQSR